MKIKFSAGIAIPSSKTDRTNSNRKPVNIFDLICKEINTTKQNFKQQYGLFFIIYILPFGFKCSRAVSDNFLIPGTLIKKFPTKTTLVNVV